MIIHKFTHFSSINTKFRSFSSLNPNWVVGFTDAEGCFTIIVSKIKQKYKITASFEINPRGQSDFRNYKKFF